MAEFILCQFSLLPLEVQVKLQALPMVPVTRLNGNKTSRFALAAEIIDPSVPELKGLCFDDEEIFPKKSFFRKFSVALKGCGLKSVVDEAVIENRVRCYANTKYPFLDIQKRAQRLLKSTCGLASPPKEQEDSDLRRLVWLPTEDLSGTLSLKASDKCRGRRDRLRVSSQQSLPSLYPPSGKSGLAGITDYPMVFYLNSLVLAFKGRTGRLLTRSSPTSHRMTSRSH
jgi:sacsin